MLIYGDTILLRPFEDPITEEDAARVYRWSSDQELLRLSGGTPTDLTFTEFREHLNGERWHAPSNRHAFFIFTRAGELIGRIGIFAIDWVHRDGELGVIIGESAFWGKQYGRDAIQTLLRHIFSTTSLERIYLFTFTDNLRAQKCFAACRFRSLGAARRFSPDVGEYDGIEMEITRREFFDRPIPAPILNEKDKQ
jgi:[ribosomal protein S5]-alanine N-acetyltransferase